MDNEKIRLDLLEAPEGQKKDSRTAFAIIQRLLCAVFILIGLCLHATVVFHSVEYLKNEGEGFLFSFIVPEWERSAPMVPQLDDGITLEDTKGEEIGEATVKTVERDLSTKAALGLSLLNETAYSPDLYQLLGSDRPAPTAKEAQKEHASGAPLVLIYHTHGTEAYVDTKKTSFRTDDPHKNTVAVGRVIREVLEAGGIATLHLEEQFDRDDWNSAYENSNEAVRRVLKDNPSIQYVFDVHRDCIGNEREGYVKGITSAYERGAAQLMFVCGTDEGGSGHTGWRSNLTFALQLQSALTDKHPCLMRSVNLRRASFYQDTRPCALILECGTCANTLVEAKTAAVLFACSLADYILGDGSGPDEEEMLDTLLP